MKVSVTLSITSRSAIGGFEMESSLLIRRNVEQDDAQLTLFTSNASQFARNF